MAGPLDSRMKLLVDAAPQHFVNWLLAFGETLYNGM